LPTVTKNALVTGSSRGIGRAIARRLAAAGHRCVVHYRRNEEAARATAEELASLGPKPVMARADLNDDAEVRALFDTVAVELGTLDVFVANAASARLRPLLATEPQDADQVLRQAVTHFILSARLATELMPDGGRMIAISGLQSRSVIPGYGVLGPAKAATEELVKHLAVELGPRRITVNAVVPGFIETESARATLGERYEQNADRLVSCTPVGRPGRPEDVASLVAFLCSDEADFLTAQAIVLDGGMSVLGVPSILNCVEDAR
jgi:enoyl-[acyl-carrier protein] reductase III